MLDLCLVWTPMPQVTEQELHAAQLQSLSGRNIILNSCNVALPLLHHLLCKLWQRRMVEWEAVRGFKEKSGKEEGWVCSEDWLD